MSSILALYASGRTTGIVIDIGADITTAMPVADSMPVIKGGSALPLFSVVRYSGFSTVSTYLRAAQY